jgi:hypothetical protein
VLLARTAQARLTFLDTYRNAYKYLGIVTHIDEAKKHLNGCDDAIEEASKLFYGKSFFRCLYNVTQCI